MRILVYGASGTQYGGIESFLLCMGRHMSTACVFDHVIVGPGCGYEAQIEAAGGRVYRVTSYKKSPLRFLWDSWRVARQARATHTVAYFNLFSMCHIGAVLLCRLLGYRVVLHAHNNGLPDRGWAYRALHRLGRRLLQGMDCVRLTNSMASAEFLFGPKLAHSDRVTLIYNAIELPRYRFSPRARRRVRQELGAGEQWVIGFAGRLEAQKDPLFLLEIFRAIHQSAPEAQLWIAGEGSLRPAVEHRIAQLGLGEWVRLLGARQDMAALYQGMDAFVLPSRFEGLGIVLVEAQAAGLPCFTTAGVVPELARLPGQTLRFLEREQGPAIWAASILQALRKPQPRPRATVAAGSRYDVTREAPLLESVLRGWEVRG